MNKRTINKLETITHRPGSPKKTIFLSQKIAGKRFSYMEEDKSKNQNLEVNGRITKHFPQYYNPAKNSNPIRCTTPESFINIKRFKFPDSKRTLDHSLQPELKSVRLRTPSRKRTNDSNISDSGSITTLMRSHTPIEVFTGGGRKHNPIMYKSFTFETLKYHSSNEKPQNRLKKLTIHSGKNSGQILPPPQVPRTTKVNHTYTGWKNGLWDLSTPAKIVKPMGNIANISSGISAIMGGDIIISNNNESKVHKYLPLSHNNGKSHTSNLGFGKTNLSKLLQSGHDTSEFKRNHR